MAYTHSREVPENDVYQIDPEQVAQDLLSETVPVGRYNYPCINDIKTRATKGLLHTSGKEADHFLRIEHPEKP